MTIIEYKDVNGHTKNISAQAYPWPSFCGGNILQAFALNYQPGTFAKIDAKVDSLAEAAKAMVELSCRTGSLGIADRKGNVGSTHIIDQLPRQWTNKKTGFTYYVTKSPVYKNSIHNSDVHHATIFRKKCATKKKKTSTPIAPALVRPAIEVPV